jgi:type VI secretion system Hcp family effector
MTTPRKLAVLTTLGLAILVLSAQPSRADDAFAKITGTTQGAILGDHPSVGVFGSENAIRVFATTFGIANPPSEPGGVVPGNPTPKPVGFLKRFDRASPKLLRAAFTGESLTVEIVWYMPLSGSVKRTATVKLEGAFIVGIDGSAQLDNSGAAGFEQVSLSYSKITFSTPDVGGTKEVTVCIDVVNNKIC